MKRKFIFSFLMIAQVLFAKVNNASIRNIKKFYQSAELNDADSSSSNMILDLSAELPASSSEKVHKIQEYSAIQKFLLEKKPLDCQEFESDLIECFAYNLFLRNSEKFQELNPENVLIKPILTKHFTNKTVTVGENVTFACETQIDALPLFFFYKIDPLIFDLYNSFSYEKSKIDLLDKFAVGLQDKNNLFNDYATIDRRYVLQRREHSLDSNKDPLSDLETINLHILNTTKQDSAFYLCIVANNPKSFRVTYSYLSVVDPEATTKQMNTYINSNSFFSSMPSIHDLSSKNFLERNKFLILSIACLFVIVVLIVALSMCYCCLQCMRTKRQKEKFKYSVSLNKEILGMSGSKVNTLLERTMSTMRKNFVYSSITPNEIENNQVISSSSTNSSMVSSQRCATFDSQDVRDINKNGDYLNDFSYNANTNLLSVDSQWEFQKERLKIGKLLDEGAFGRVYMADAYGILQGRYKTVVAVKMLKENSTKDEFTNFLKELEIMKNVGRHENIISLLGCCTKIGPIYAIVEYAKFGNLRNYLRSQRPKDYILCTDGAKKNKSTQEDPISNSNINSSDDEYQSPEEALTNNVNNYTDNLLKLYSGVKNNKLNFVSEKSSKPDSSIEPTINSTSDLETLKLTIDLIRFCVQISNGMKYLHSMKVCHRDLAARNILLNEFKIAKIADFGFARDLKQNYYYTRKSESPIPVKWMSPETLFDRKFYKNSDIWSFGVCMWEIFTLGGNPYPSVPVEKLFDYLKDGNRMSKPMFCDDEIYKLILDCWHFKPDMRPSFSEINEKLSIILGKYEHKNLELTKMTEYLIDDDSKIGQVSFKNKPLLVPSSVLSKVHKPDVTQTELQYNNSKRDSSDRSKSEDSQYFSSTDTSQVYADSSTFSSNHSEYSNYSGAPPSMMIPSNPTIPPSPPPIKPLSKLLNVASAAYNL